MPALMQEALQLGADWAQGLMPQIQQRIHERLRQEGLLSDKDELQVLESALGAAPGDAGILNQIAWLRATAKDLSVRDPEKALAYARLAMEASGGKNPYILDTLAEAHYVNQEFDEAIEVEEKAIEMDPDNEFFRSQLKKFQEAKRIKGGRPGASQR